MQRPELNRIAARHLVTVVVVAALGIFTGLGTVNAESRVARLDAAHLRICQNRETSVIRLLGFISNRARRQMDLFSTIFSRVQTYYTERGRTVDNYSTLVDAVTAKKHAAENQVAQLLGKKTFSCSTDDPKGAIQAFVTQLHATNAALKEYRTAVKNLIVGVRSEQGASNTNQSNTNAANVNATNING